MSKFLELAKKLKSLAEGGTDHEKTASALLLGKLMAKHNISVAELEGSTVQGYFFKMHPVDTNRPSIFQQVCAKILGSSENRIHDVKKGGKKIPNEYAIICTSFEAIDIESQYEHYANKYAAELKLFFAAFVHSNNLYPTDSINNAILTKEELQRQAKIRALASKLEGDDYLKRLR